MFCKKKKKNSDFNFKFHVTEQEYYLLIRILKYYGFDVVETILWYEYVYIRNKYVTYGSSEYMFLNKIGKPLPQITIEHFLNYLYQMKGSILDDVLSDQVSKYKARDYAVK